MVVFKSALRQIGQGEVLYKCRLLLIEDPPLKLSPGSMWRCLGLSSIESDGVNRSTCTELSCSVYISWTMHTKANYPYPAAHPQCAVSAPYAWLNL